MFEALRGTETVPTVLRVKLRSLAGGAVTLFVLSSAIGGFTAGDVHAATVHSSSRVRTSTASSPYPLTAYITDGSGPNVHRIQVTSPADFAIQPDFPVTSGSANVGVAASPDGARVYATVDSLDTAETAVVDTASQQVLSMVQAPQSPAGAAPWGPAVTPDGRTVFVANADNSDASASNQPDSVSAIDVAANPPAATTISLASVAPNGEPLFVAVSPDGQTAYVSVSGPNVLVPISVQTETPGTPMPMAGTQANASCSPGGVAVTPDSRRILVSCTDNAAADVVDAAAGTVTPIQLNTSSEGGSHGGGDLAAVTPDGHTGIVGWTDPNLGGQLSFIDLTQSPPAVTASVSIPELTLGSVVVTPDGVNALLTTPGVTYVIDLTTSPPVVDSTTLNVPGYMIALARSPSASGGSGAPAVQTQTLPNGAVGMQYSSTLQAGGGMSPYSWSLISGSLPNGLSLDPSSGAITGTPATANTYSFTVQVTDANGQTANQQLSITVVPPGYAPMTPARLFDTRNEGGPMGPGATLVVQVAGVDGVPSGASSVAINVTAVNATSPTYVTVWPDGTNRPLASTLNPAGSAAIPNFDVVAIGSDGKIDMYNLAGSVDLLADIEGFYTPGAGYTPMTPVRVCDTRDGTGVNQGVVGPGGSISVQVAGVDGVPPNATAVALNITAVDATRSTYVTVWPDGTGRPVASNLNPGGPAAVANFDIVAIGSGGMIDLYNLAGSVDLVCDVQGYFTSGAAYTPMTPVRIFDTRSGGAVDAVGPQTAIWVQVAGVGGIPANAKAVAINVTAVDATSSTYITVWPYGASQPVASNLNPNSPAAVPNFDIVQIGSDGRIEMYNLAGSIDLLGDVAGYYT